MRCQYEVRSIDCCVSLFTTLLARYHLDGAQCIVVAYKMRKCHTGQQLRLFGVM